MFEIGSEAAQLSFSAALVRGIIAGWLIALVVWLTAADRRSPLVVIGIPTYVLAVAQLAHIVVGSVEVLFLVMTGNHGWGDYWLRFFTPALIGNCIGGVTLVAALNHAQVTSGEDDSHPTQQFEKAVTNRFPEEYATNTAISGGRSGQLN
jgi:formate/nitrite transporter FocA (FNT family)